MIYPTSSKTALLLQCGWPFGIRQNFGREAVGEAALYGTDYHGAAAYVLSNGTVDDPKLRTETADEVSRHITATIPPLKEWLAQHHWRTDHEFVEAAFLYHVHTRKTRRTQLNTENHHYHGHGVLEIGGTVDFASWHAGDRRLFILDHKTGEHDPGDPAEHPQLLTLACIMSGFFRKVNGVSLALHWAPRHRPAEIRSKVVHPARIEAHARDLRRAMAEIDSGRLRPGPECEYCPARHQCPTRTNALAIFKPETMALDRPWTSDEAAFVHQNLALYRDMSRMLERKVRETISEHGVGLRPDGKTLHLETRPYSTLSLASIRRALPKEEAEALIDELGAKGCIETNERIELRACKPKEES